MLLHEREVTRRQSSSLSILSPRLHQGEHAWYEHACMGAPLHLSQCLSASIETLREAQAQQFCRGQRLARTRALCGFHSVCSVVIYLL